jgi:hypothetical protein
MDNNPNKDTFFIKKQFNIKGIAAAIIHVVTPD